MPSPPESAAQLGQLCNDASRPSCRNTPNHPPSPPPATAALTGGEGAGARAEVRKKVSVVSAAQLSLAKPRFFIFAVRVHFCKFLLLAATFLVFSGLDVLGLLRGCGYGYPVSPRGSPIIS